jgi:hypothetical protein
MFTIMFWKRATERAVKSGAQAVLLGLGFSDAGPVNALQFDYKLGLGFAAGGALLSYLTSLVTAPLAGDPDDPSMVG